MFFTQGCTTAHKANRPVEGFSTSLKGEVQPQAPEVGPFEAYGPPIPDSTTYGPIPLQIRPVVLVLGPGLARGFSYAGVFRALNEAKIPIGAVFGTEMGGLVGALYAMSANPNQFEWGLLKFKEDIFIEPKSFFSSDKVVPSNGDRLEMKLVQVFGNKDLKESKIPITLVIESKDTGVSMVVGRGKIVKALRAALAAPEIFLPSDWEGKKQYFSAAGTRPFLVSEAKNSEIGPVIVIDVLGESEEAVAQDELKFADLIIKPDLTGITSMDFKKRTDAAFQGKSAVIQHLPEIRRLVGLPEVNIDQRRFNP